MRALFFVLLAANLALAAYALLRPKEGGEPQIMSQQLNAEQIRIIPARAPRRLLRASPRASSGAVSVRRS